MTEMRQTYTEDTEEIRSFDIIERMNEMVVQVPEDEIEFIDFANKLWEINKRSQWLTGLIFARREQIIKDTYSAWYQENEKMLKTRKKVFGDTDREMGAPIKNLYEFFQRNEKRLNLSYAQAMQCKALFEGTTQEIGEELGTRKFALIRTLPEPIRAKIAQEAVVKDLTADEVKEKVLELRQREERREEQREKDEKIMKRVERELGGDPAINTVTRGSSVTITANNFDVKFLQSAMDYFEGAIKNYVKKCIANEKAGR